ncbi:MAG: hypothetical protein LBE75_01660 [Burkholderiales bacterium]|nr:hypothetical protein [Burkholderiales bacterium]
MSNSMEVDKGTLRRLSSPSPGLTEDACFVDGARISSDSVTSWCAYLFFLIRNQETAANDEKSLKLLMAPEQITIKAWLSSPEVFGLLPFAVSVKSSSPLKTNEAFSRVMENTEAESRVDFSFSKKKITALKQFSPSQMKQELYRISSTLTHAKHSVAELASAFSCYTKKNIEKMPTNNMAGAQPDTDPRTQVIKILGIAFPVSHHVLGSLNIGGARGAMLSPATSFCKNKAFTYGFTDASKADWANELK